MKPGLKFGLIGGVVFTLILISGTYFLEQTVRNMTMVVYLKVLVLIISIVGSVKAVRDLNKNSPLELRDGLRTGLGTVSIICLFVLLFNMIYPFTVSEADSIANNEIVYVEHFKRVPITDTTEAAFVKEKQSYETSMKSGDIGMASLSLRKAKIIRPNAVELEPKIKEIDHLMFLKSMELGFLFKNVFVTFVFPQLVMGFLIAFVTTLLFRSKQQARF